MQVVKSQMTLLKAMLSATDKLVIKAVPELITQARQNAEQDYQQEIDHLRHELQSVLQQLDATVAQLDSLRVIVVTGE